MFIFTVTATAIPYNSVWPTSQRGSTLWPTKENT